MDWEYKVSQLIANHEKKQYTFVEFTVLLLSNETLPGANVVPGEVWTMAHVGPENVGRQLQTNVFTLSKQVPPFVHGPEAQGLMPN